MVCVLIGVVHTHIDAHISRNILVGNKKEGSQVTSGDETYTIVHFGGMHFSNLQRMVMVRDDGDWLEWWFVWR